MAQLRLYPPTIGPRTQRFKKNFCGVDTKIILPSMLHPKIFTFPTFRFIQAIDDLFSS